MEKQFLRHISINKYTCILVNAKFDLVEKKKMKAHIKETRTELKKKKDSIAEYRRGINDNLIWNVRLIWRLIDDQRL